MKGRFKKLFCVLLVFICLVCGVVACSAEQVYAPSVLNIELGSSVNFSLTVVPFRSVKAKYTVEDSSVATVTNNGVVTALAVGTTTLTSIYKNKEYKTVLEVVPKSVPLESISLAQASQEIGLGDMVYLPEVIFTPSNATNKNVSWISLDSTVASVGGGLIFALSAGQTQLVGISEDGGFEITYTVTVVGIPQIFDSYVYPLADTQVVRVIMPDRLIYSVDASVDTVKNYYASKYILDERGDTFSGIETIQGTPYYFEVQVSTEYLGYQGVYVLCTLSELKTTPELPNEFVADTQAEIKFSSSRTLIYRTTQISDEQVRLFYYQNFNAIFNGNYAYGYVETDGKKQEITIKISNENNVVIIYFDVVSQAFIPSEILEIVTVSNDYWAKGLASQGQRYLFEAVFLVDTTALSYDEALDYVLGLFDRAVYGQRQNDGTRSTVVLRFVSDKYYYKITLTHTVALGISMVIDVSPQQKINVATDIYAIDGVDFYEGKSDNTGVSAYGISKLSAEQIVQNVEKVLGKCVPFGNDTYLISGSNFYLRLVVNGSQGNYNIVLTIGDLSDIAVGDNYVPAQNQLPLPTEILYVQNIKKGVGLYYATIYSHDSNANELAAFFGVQATAVSKNIMDANGIGGAASAVRWIQLKYDYVYCVTIIDFKDYYQTIISVDSKKSIDTDVLTAYGVENAIATLTQGALIFDNYAISRTNLVDMTLSFYAADFNSTVAKIKALSGYGGTIVENRLYVFNIVVDGHKGNFVCKLQRLTDTSTAVYTRFYIGHKLYANTVVLTDDFETFNTVTTALTLSYSTKLSALDTVKFVNQQYSTEDYEFTLDLWTKTTTATVTEYSIELYYESSKGVYEAFTLTVVQSQNNTTVTYAHKTQS